ncbi:sulfatase family protein [Novipirellula herctigrandis]
MILPTLLLALLCPATIIAAAEKPNIVYILADDMGIGEIACYNSEGKIPTPHVDALASQGMKFMDAHISSSVCTPTRYGILTGRYAWRTSLKEGVLGPYSPPLIEADRETVASFLKNHGYRTACLGKWHLGMNWKHSNSLGSRRVSAKHIDPTVPITNGPLDRGFDFFLGADSHDMHYIRNRRVDGEVTLLGSRAEIEKRTSAEVKFNQLWAIDGFAFEDRLALMATETDQWIRQAPDQPFFVYLALHSPHNPIVPSKDFQGKSGLNSHADYCMETDWVVGQVLKTLDELKLADDTIVIFTADNGTSPAADVGTLLEKGHNPSWKYRGLKGTLWEGGHRVPFVVRWPGNIQPGTESHQTICSTDLLASCADLFEQKLPDNVGEDSISFLPALKGDTIPGVHERMIVHHSDAGVFAIRKGKWKLMFDKDGGSRRGVNEQKSNPVIDSADHLLFDMQKDESETTNLLHQHPEVVESLKKDFASLIKVGRSTPGAPQKNAPLRIGETWTQIEVLDKYLK